MTHEFLTERERREMREYIEKMVHQAMMEHLVLPGLAAIEAERKPKAGAAPQTKGADHGHRS